MLVEVKSFMLITVKYPEEFASFEPIVAAPEDLSAELLRQIMKFNWLAMELSDTQITLKTLKA